MGHKLTGSHRSADHHSEKMLAGFLDEYFWKRLEKNGRQYKWQNDKNMQYRGVDIVLKDNDKIFYIDEKSTMSYSNAMIPTFAFEINSIQSDGGKPLLGWFLNDGMLTTHYLLVWANFKCKYDAEIGEFVRKEKAELTEDDIVSCEVFLVENSKIRELLESYGWDKERILSKTTEIRNGTRSGKIDVNEKDFYFFYTKYLAEKPVNIVIKKHKLKEIACEKYLITKLGMGPMMESRVLH